MDNLMSYASMDLFKVVPSSMTKIGGPRFTTDEQLQKGICFVNENFMPISAPISVFQMADELYGVSAEQFNETFYKSFSTVAEADRWTLFVDQIVHYLGTYGLESKGYDPITIIPVQKLEIPGADTSDLKITIIRAVGIAELENLTNDFAANVKSPSKRMTERFKALLPLCSVSLDNIRSFELMIMVADYHKKVPVRARSFLRFIIYKTTGSTLVIKNNDLIKDIVAQKDNVDIAQYFQLANLQLLSAEFLRFRPLWLAFKKYPGCAPYINKMRRMAKNTHRPLPYAVMQNFVQLALNGRVQACENILRASDNRELVKLINYIQYLGSGSAKRVYSIRNGKTFVKEAQPVEFYDGQTLYKWRNRAAAILSNRLKNAYFPDQKTGAIILPDNIRYAAPVSEKQFIGNIPWGTQVADDDSDEYALTVGIHWFNGENDRTDLDLHGYTPDTHFGWNSEYSDDDALVVYSGDMTNAPLPNGASECYWVDSRYASPLMLSVSEYHGPDKQKFKLLVSHVKPEVIPVSDRFDAPYVMDPKEAVAPPIEMDINGVGSQSLGYIYKGKFTFFGGSLGGSRVPSDYCKDAVQAVLDKNERCLDLGFILNLAGFDIYHSTDFKTKYDKVLDLRVENLTATTLLDVIDGKAKLVETDPELP